MTRSRRCAPGWRADGRGRAEDAFLFAIRSKGVTDARVLAAMEAIDRGAFVRGLFAERAYEDMPLPIACGQTISQPSVVGLMTQALELTGREKVLEIGTGSGYQAASAQPAGAPGLYGGTLSPPGAEARASFAALDLVNITVVHGDGSRGLPDQAPFDRIIVTAAAEDPPGPLLAQLRIGGIMVAAGRPVRHGAEPDPRAPDRTRVRLRGVARGALRAAGRGAGRGVSARVQPRMA
jgi:protein-L-isoaspartate(D-aspartate) O-methyltransferase